MKALLLFSESSVKEGKTDPERLVSLLAQADPSSSFTAACFENLVFHITSDKAKVFDSISYEEISNFDCVYFRYWGDTESIALAAARYCFLMSIPLVDSEILRPGSYTKLNQYINLHALNLPIPETLIARKDLIIGSYKRYFQGFPLLAKAIRGTRGSDNYLVRNEEELINKLQNSTESFFTLQSFIPNDGDYRVLVMGDTIPLLIHRKASQGSHLNNTSQGGVASLVDINTLPGLVQEQCIRAAKYFGRTIAGVDVVKSLKDSKYYFLEVNRAPQIENSSFEKEKARALTGFLKGLKAPKSGKAGK